MVCGSFNKTLLYGYFLEVKPTISQTPLTGRKKGDKITHFSIQFFANCVD
jgi:hypothetical protein